MENLARARARGSLRSLKFNTALRAVLDDIPNTAPSNMSPEPFKKDCGKLRSYWNGHNLFFR